MTNRPDPMQANIWDLIAVQCAAQPERRAITFEGREISYGALAEMVAALARGLRAQNIGPGDRVAGMVDKSPEGLALTFAVFRIGAVYVPVNPGFSAAEATTILEDAAPALLVTDTARGALPGPRSLPLAELAAAGAGSEPLPATAPGGTAPCAMLFTSGTTGRPKGARISHRNMCATFTAFNAMWQITGADRLLHVLPTFHAHGLLMATLCPLFAGGEIVLLPKFDIDRVVALLPSVSVLMAVPTIYSRLVGHPGFTAESCRALRLATSGSAPLSPDLFDTVKARTGLTLTDRYGSTEAGMVAANPAGAERRGSVGRPLPGVEIRLSDPEGRAVGQGQIGSIHVRSPHVFHGYWNRPDLDGAGLQQGGWFDTGDLGRFDDDGYLYIVGRNKDMIISGGFNIYPREIELALEACPGVAEAAVFGVPHPDFGEGVVAVVRLHPGAAGDTAVLGAELRTSLASYKRPKAIFLRDAIPRNELGKIQKPLLSEMYSATFLPAGA